MTAGFSFLQVRRPVLGGGFILLVVAAWEILCRSGAIRPAFAPAPTAIATTVVGFLTDPAFWTKHMLASGQGVGAGWLLALVVGLSLGFLMGWYSVARDAFEPLVMAFYNTPKLALVPLFIVWFGFGFEYKLVAVFLSAVFPLLLNTITGVRNADAGLVRMARSFGATDRQLCVGVVLPGAVPYVLTGLRHSVVNATGAVVAAEIFSSVAGLGYVIGRAGQLEQIDRLFAAVVIVAAIGAGLNEVLLRIEAHFQRWRPETARV